MCPRYDSSTLPLPESATYSLGTQPISSSASNSSSNTLSHVAHVTCSGFRCWCYIFDVRFVRALLFHQIFCVHCFALDYWCNNIYITYIYLVRFWVFDFRRHFFESDNFRAAFLQLHLSTQIPGIIKVRVFGTQNIEILKKVMRKYPVKTTFVNFAKFLYIKQKTKNLRRQSRSVNPPNRQIDSSTAFFFGLHKKQRNTRRYSKRRSP